MAVEYGKSGKIIPKRFTLDEIEQASEDMVGFCLACGEEAECCEPDARNYKCSACGNSQVFGAEELVLMGRVTP
ncbi:hypothetical protein [Methylocapsa aurea]|jgi:hypothetical protein|uniref:hypothetical protein n=1 Tax=Methylocapsa aurea TaxID=663610 RepID=UPI00056319D2|nr:hypothetical protein [Methylocapsa aurea]